MFVPASACQEELLGPGKVWSAFVGPGVRICDGDMIADQDFSGPAKFFRLSWDQGFEYVSGTGSQKKSFSGPRKFFRLSWDQGFECVTGTSQKKTFRAPESFFGFRGPGVRIYDGDRVVEKTVRASKSFFSIATKSGMTASAYLVNFKINLGDLAEVALIWPDHYGWRTIFYF